MTEQQQPWGGGRAGQAALKKLDLHLAVAVGVFLLAVFPVLGNACVFAVLPDARRFAQFAFFAAGLTLVLVPTIRGHYGQVISELRGTALPRALGAGSLLLAAVCAWNLFTLHAKPGAYEAVGIAAIWGWICLAAAILAYRRSLFVPAASTQSTKPWSGFRRLLWVLGACLAIFGWLSGPPDNLNAHIGFGGSTISVGTAGAIGFGLSLLLFPFPRNLLAAACWAYLFIFSTARTAAAIAAVLYIAYFGRELFCSSVRAATVREPTACLRARLGGICWRLGRACLRSLAALAIPLLLVLPMAMRSRYYPFYSPKADEDLLEYREEEFVRRFSRLYRVLPFMSIYEIPACGPNVYWCNGAGTWQPQMEEAILDAGRGASVYKVSLSPSVDYPELFPKEFVLQGSPDGRNWSTLAVERNYQPAAGKAYKVVFSPRPMRIARLRGWSSCYANGRHYLVLGKFELFGTGPLLRVARAEASGVVNSDHEAEYAIDQDFSTFWHSPNRPSPTEEWLCLDLGAPSAVNRIRLWPALSYPQLFPSQFTLEGSRDQNQWRSLASETDFDAAKHQSYEVSVDQSPVQFIRLRGLSPAYTPESYCMLIAEAEVFGQLLPLPVASQSRQDTALEGAECAVLTLDLDPPQLLNHVRLFDRGAKTQGQVLLETQGEDGSWGLAAQVSMPVTDVFFEGRKARRVRARASRSSRADFEMQLFYRPSSLPVRVISPALLAAHLLESTPAYSAGLARATPHRNAGYYADLVQKLQTQPDDRISVLARTFAVTTERLTGQWPVPYQEKTKSTYRYPHNFTLEVAYYAGWPVSLIATFALAVAVLWGLWTISTAWGLVDLILAVCVVAFAVRMQLTADLPDHVNVLVLCWLLVLRKAAGVQEATES